MRAQGIERITVLLAAAAAMAVTDAAPAMAQQVTIQEYPLPAFSHPHDVAPAADGGIWFTAQIAGALGWLDPATGKTRSVPLGLGSGPHGVIVGPDGAPWLTMEGANAIIRVDPVTSVAKRFPLPSTARRADLNTATFDSLGKLWFTGQAGWYGRLDPASGAVAAFAAPRGAGPYGMYARKTGPVYFVSLAGGYMGIIDPETTRLALVDPPVVRTGPRRVWLDSRGTAWVTGWDSGKLLRYEPGTGTWKQFDVPGAAPQPYAVYVDEHDRVWISDFGDNALHMFDPASEHFTTYPVPTKGAEIRQLAGRPGEVCGAESAKNKLIVIRFGQAPKP
jgi:virginiamycin B lyase